MPQEVFVDAGAWIGIRDVGDQHHRAAPGTYRDLVRQARTLATTILVIAEAYIAIRCRLSLEDWLPPVIPVGAAVFPWDRPDPSGQRGTASLNFGAPLVAARPGLRR